MILIRLMVLVLILGCEGGYNNGKEVIFDWIKKDSQIGESLINPEGNHIHTRINTPKDYQRQNYPANSFQHYLQSFPLKAHGSKVMLYDGSEKINQNAHVAVLDIDVGRKNLQQCADAVIRLRAEYLWKESKYEEISFHFTNGFQADYTKWRAGHRIQVDGNRVSWYKRYGETTTYKSFQQYLEKVFIYAGSISLSGEMHQQELSSIETGNVFVRAGSPGHAVIVIDKAIHHETGETLVLLAQSYMPAQEMHILKNPNNNTISPWYAISEIEGELRTPEWRFDAVDLKQF